MIDKKFCIIVPVFENKENLVKFIHTAETLLNKNKNIDLLFVNDGNDYKLEDLINVNNKNFHILNNKKNIGYGASIKRAVQFCNSEIIGIIDCDNSYDLNQLIELVSEFETYNCDLLVGRRIFEYKDSILKIQFRKIINTLSTIIFNYKVEDINSGLRVFFRKDFIKDIDVFPDKFSITSTQTLCAIARNKEIKYIDSKYSKRDGKSKINILIDPIRFIYLIFKIFLIFSPIKFFGGFGVSIIALSLFVLIYSLLFLDKILDVTFLIMFIAGLNFIFFGLIAEIIKIYSNKKD
jgi:GT2 family glycosyltransferase|tara:strand:- start:317 stop:1195 length:879 start_codon:yes stop_codon:yes gene_type:complete